MSVLRAVVSRFWDAVRQRPIARGGVVVGGCPVESNGQLIVWLLGSGQLAIICDECDAAWLDPTAMSWENADHPSMDPPLAALLDRSSVRARIRARVRLVIPPRRRPTFALSGGDVLVRPATMDEIRSGGWSHLIP